MRPGTLLRWYALKKLLKHATRHIGNIIDIGGYDGYVAHNLMKANPALKITVVDLDKNGLEIANSKGLAILNASVLNLPFEADFADLIICLDLLEHVHEDDLAIREMSRVVKKGGRIILTTPMETGVSFPFMTKKEIDVVNQNFGHVRKGYSIGAIRHLLKKHGLAITNVGRYFNFLSRFAYWLVSFSHIRIKTKNIFYQWVVKLEPYIKYKAQEYIVVAIKT